MAYFLSFTPEPDVSGLDIVSSDEARPDALGSEVPVSSGPVPARDLCSSLCDMLGVMVRWMMCYSIKDQNPPWA